MIYDETNFTKAERPGFAVGYGHIFPVEVPQSEGFRVQLVGSSMGPVLWAGIFKIRRAAELYLAWVKLQ